MPVVRFYLSGEMIHEAANLLQRILNSSSGGSMFIGVDSLCLKCFRRQTNVAAVSAAASVSVDTQYQPPQSQQIVVTNVGQLWFIETTVETKYRFKKLQRLTERDNGKTHEQFGKVSWVKLLE